jgi:serine/threonine-protein kinase RsbW
MKDTKEIISLIIPARAEYIDIVRLTLYGIATRMGYTYEDIEDMKVAVSEACNNVVLHAYDDLDGKVEIRFDISDLELSIVVKDDGKSFNYISVENSTILPHEQSLEDVQVGGLGIFMMQALMDHVQVKIDKGTEVTLTKHLSRGEAMT